MGGTGVQSARWSWMVAAVWAALGVLLVSVVLASYHGSDVRAVLEVIGKPTSTSLEVGVSSCNENPVVEVTESASEVRLLARADRRWPGSSGNDCADGVKLVLQDPLGYRTVVDASTGRELSVSSFD